MPHYKLTYFDARGLGEVARQLFVLADVPFEDNRLSIEEFKELKATLPSGQVPILEVDGFEISQSAAIYRYLARKFGFAGKTLEESATADSVVDHFKDFMSNFKSYGAGIFMGGMTKEQMEKARKEIVEPAAQAYFTVLKKFLSKSSSGYIAGGDGLTFADLVVAENLSTLKNTEFFIPEQEPELNKFWSKIQNEPKLNWYLEQRKFSVL